MHVVRIESSFITDDNFTSLLKAWGQSPRVVLFDTVNNWMRGYNSRLDERGIAVVPCDVWQT